MAYAVLRAKRRQTLRKIIQTVKAADAQPLLMQIHLPAQLRFAVIMNQLAPFIPESSPKFDIPLLPFLWKRYI